MSSSVTNKEVSYLSLVTQADPDFFAASARDIEYSFGKGRKFRGDQRRRGAYSDTGPASGSGPTGRRSSFSPGYSDGFE